MSISTTPAHPGAIQTELGRYLTPEITQQLIEQINANRRSGATAFSYKTIPQGAATTVWAAVVASAEEVGGRYCEDCHVAEIMDGGAEVLTRGGVRPYALNQERAKALWEKSQQLVGEQF